MNRLPSLLLSLSQRYALICTFFAGVLLSAAFAPYGLWPLAVLSPAWLFHVWQGATARRAAQLGFWFTAGTFLAGTFWLYHSIHTVGGAPIWLAIFLLLALVAIMGLYSALLGYLQARWLPATGWSRWLLGLPALWTLVEWARGWLFTGFPWLSLGYAHIDSPLAAWAPIVGVYGITLASVWSAGGLVMLLHGMNRQRWVVLVALLLPWLAAWPLWHREWTAVVNGPLSVAIVQGSVPQDKKWSPEWRDEILTRYRTLTEPHLGTNLIIWPEAALPEPAQYLVDYLQKLWSEARARNSDLLIGAVNHDRKENRYYNGLLALNDDVEWYHKRRLVPYGEFFPVPDFVRNWLRMMSLPSTNLTAGADQQAPLHGAGQAIGATICYEDAYGAEQREVLRDATLLVNVTNDAWFGDYSAAPQHLEISRMRALEAGRDLARAANDGISALIDSQGRVRATLPRYAQDVLTGKLQPRTGLTPYARIGDRPVIVAALLLLLIAMTWRFGWLNRFRSTSTPSNPSANTDSA